MFFAIVYIGEIPIHNPALYTFLGLILFLYIAFIAYLVSCGKREIFNSCGIGFFISSLRMCFHVFVLRFSTGVVYACELRRREACKGRNVASFGKLSFIGQFRCVDSLILLDQKLRCKSELGGPSFQCLPRRFWQRAERLMQPRPEDEGDILQDDQLAQTTEEAESPGEFEPWFFSFGRTLRVGLNCEPNLQERSDTLRQVCTSGGQTF